VLIHDTNKILKFADDTYLVVPAVTTMTCADELSHIESWATENNLKLNCTKAKEIIFQSCSNREKVVQLAPPQQGVELVDKITTLGIVVNNRLTAANHIRYIMTACSSLLFALCVPRSHGLPETSIKDVLQATVFAKITYCLPAWFGFGTAADRDRLNSFLRHCVKLGFWSSSNTPCISTVAEDIVDTLFNKITCYHYHILQSYLPDRPDIDYYLRERHHNKTNS